MTTDFWKKLIEWHNRQQRTLPWDNERDPYKVWVSEIMLQQTVVAAALDHYKKWMDRFPRVEDLAQAEEPEVLRLWEGLGYYSRVRNLLKAAKQIVSTGIFPETYDQWRDLPGIGDYTASAILAFSGDQPYLTLDANLKKVFQRLEGHREWTVETEARWRARMGAAFREFSPRELNLSLMHLGQLLCSSQNPDCLACPLSPLCQAKALGIQNQIPTKKTLETEAGEEWPVVISRDGWILMESPQTGRFQGQWIFPSGPAGWWFDAFGSALEIQGNLTNQVHSYTKFRITLHPQAALWNSQVLFVAEAPPGRERQWVRREDLGQLPVPSVYRKIIDEYLGNLFYG